MRSIAPSSRGARSRHKASTAVFHAAVEALDARRLLSAAYYQLVLGDGNGPPPGDALYIKSAISTNGGRSDKFLSLAGNDTTAAANLISQDVTGSVDMCLGPAGYTTFDWVDDNATDDSKDFKIADLTYDPSSDRYSGDIQVNDAAPPPWGDGSHNYQYYESFSLEPLQVGIVRERDGTERLEGSSAGQSAQFRVTTNGLAEGPVDIQVGVDTEISTAVVGDQVGTPPSDVSMSDAEPTDDGTGLTKVFDVPVRQNNKVEGDTTLFMQVTGGSAHFFGAEAAATIVDTDDGTIEIGWPTDGEPITAGADSILPITYRDHYGDPMATTIDVTNFDPNILQTDDTSISIGADGTGTLKVHGMNDGSPADDKPLTLKERKGATTQSYTGTALPNITVAPGSLTLYAGQSGVDVTATVRKPLGTAGIAGLTVKVTDPSNSNDVIIDGNNATTDADGKATFRVLAEHNTNGQAVQLTITATDPNNPNAANPPTTTMDVTVKPVQWTVTFPQGTTVSKSGNGAPLSVKVVVKATAPANDPDPAMAGKPIDGLSVSAFSQNANLLDFDNQPNGGKTANANGETGSAGNNPGEWSFRVGVDSNATVPPGGMTDLIDIFSSGDFDTMIPAKSQNQNSTVTATQ